MRVTAWCRRWKQRDGSHAKSERSADLATKPVACVEVKVAKDGSMPAHAAPIESVNLAMVNELSVEEISNAERFWIVQAQRESYGETYESCQAGRPVPTSSPILKLQPCLDNGVPAVLCMGGRLKTAHHLPTGMQQPVILPPKHPLTSLRIAREDTQCGHTAGVNHLLANLNKEYWIVHGPATVKQHRSRCYGCKRQWNKPAVQIMGPLPDVRTSPPYRAFSRVGVDYAGPFMTKQGRGRARAKRYLCLFTCLQSRALHLEMSYALDTDSFCSEGLPCSFQFHLPCWYSGSVILEALHVNATCTVLSLR